MFTDINRSVDTIDLNSKSLFGKAGSKINRAYVKGLVSKINPKDYNTFITKQGISFQSLCLLSNMNDEFEELVNTIGLENNGMLFKEDFHPVEIAMDTLNIKAMEIIAKNMEKNKSLLVTENLFLKALESPSNSFKKAMVEAFFDPPGLEKELLPNAIPIGDTSFPYIYQSNSKNLDQEEIDKILREQSSVEMKKYEYHRISRPISLHLSSKFIREFLNKMTENSELCASTQSSAIITYLWRRYKIYAWLYAIMFIFMTINTYIGVIW